MELRLYSFVNFYLSSIQQGIQTGHVAVDLVRKYAVDGEELSHLQDTVKEWADKHKTFITLNGGNSAGIDGWTVVASNSGFPWATFNEDAQSLGGIQTCVAMVLPETIFNAQRKVTPDTQEEYFEYADGYGGFCRYYDTHPHFTLIKLLKSARLAS